MIKFLKLFAQNLPEKLETHIANIISNGISEGVNKSSKKIFFIGISISLLATGFFLSFWGIATLIDGLFEMHGAGYLVLGIISVLFGIVLSKI